MIYRKGEFVKIKEVDFLNEQVKYFANQFGRIHKVFSLESDIPFLVEFFYDNKRETALFSHTEIELRNNLDDQEERWRYNLQAKMFQMRSKI